MHQFTARLDEWQKFWLMGRANGRSETNGTVVFATEWEVMLPQYIETWIVRYILHVVCTKISINLLMYISNLESGPSGVRFFRLGKGKFDLGARANGIICATSQYIRANRNERN